MKRLLFIIVIKLAVLCYTIDASSYNRELCPCVAIDECTATHKQLNRDDAKYFATVLKCSEAGHIRCCNHNRNHISVIASRRADTENIIIITDDAKDENIEGSTIDYLLELTTTESDDDMFATTTEVTYDNEDLKVPENDRKSNFIDDHEELILPLPDSERSSKFIDDHVAVIYPSLNKLPPNDEKKGKEALFLIFPNGEIETALKMHEQNETEIVSTTKRPYKRVVVRKRLLKKEENHEHLEGSESEISTSIIEPKNVVQVRKRFKINPKNDVTTTPKATTTTTTTTENSIADETTTTGLIKRRRKKIKKFRKTTSTPRSPLSTTEEALSTSTKSAVTLPKKKLQRDMRPEVTTAKSRRKLIYDTRSRTNFLKKPTQSLTNNHRDDEENETTTSVATPVTETSSTITSSTSTITKSTTLKPTTVATTRKPPLVARLSEIIDQEHKAMIETVHKTLTAIHSGGDFNALRTVIESQRENLKELRKIPSTQTVKSTTPTYELRSQFNSSGTTRPFRGNVKFSNTSLSLMMSQKLQQQSEVSNPPVKRFLLRAKVTRPTKKNFKIRLINPSISSQNGTSQKDFRASPLYGITMDQFSEFDSKQLEKMYGTFLAPGNVQNKTDSFPYFISNGTPSPSIN